MDNVQKFADSLGSTLKGGADDAEEHLSRIEEHAKQTGDTLAEEGERAGRSFAEGLTLALAAGAAQFLDTMRETIERASEYASNLSTLSLTTGDDRGKLQQFEFAMRSVGVSSQQAQQQLSLMERRIDAAAERSKDTTSIFYRLGISAKDMVHQDAITNFETLATKIASLKDPTDRTTAAMELFGGRLGAKLLPLLNEGQAGIQKAMAMASQMGAIIPDDVLDKLDEFDSATKELEQSTQAFFATLAGPIIPLLTGIADATMRVFEAFQHLSNDQRLTILFSLLSAAFLSFEVGLETVGSFLARNMINREIIDFLKDWNVGIYVLITAFGLFFAAYQTNFGGVRSVTAEVLGAVQTAWNGLTDALRIVSAAAQAYVIPAFERLSNAFRPLVTLIANDLTNGLLGIPWDSVTADIANVAQWLASLINEIANFISILDQWAGYIAPLFDSIAGAIGFVVSGLETLVPKFGDVKNAVYDLAQAFLILNLANITTFFSDLLPAALAAARLAFKNLVFDIQFLGLQAKETFAAIALGEDVAFPPLLLWQVAVLAVGTAVIAMSLEWTKFWNTFFNILDGIIQYFAEWIAYQAKLAQGIADVLSYIPGFNDMATAISNVAQKTLDAANAMDKWAEAEKRKHAAAIAASEKNSGAAGSAGGPSTSDFLKQMALDKAYGAGLFATPTIPDLPDVPKITPTDTLKPAVTGGSGAANEVESEELDRIKTKVDAAKNTVTEAENRVKLLDVAIGSLGKDADPAEWAIVYGEKLRAVNAQIEAQAKLVTTLQAAEAQTARDAAATKDPKGKRRYHDESMQYAAQVDSAILKHTELEASLNKIKNEQYAKDEAYYKSEASDQTLSYADRIKAEENILDIMVKEGSTIGEQTEQRLKILDLMHQQAILAEKLSSAKDALAIENLKSQSALAQDAASNETKGHNAAQVDHDNAVAAAQTEAQIAAINLKDAQQKLAIEHTNLADLEQRWGAGDTTVYEKLQTAQVSYNQAQLEATTKADDLALANQKLQEAIDKTDDDIIKLRSDIDQLIKSGIGNSLYDLFKGLTGSGTNLNEAFISLFQQSRSYYDIQTAFQEITQRLAQVFDAMRPVVDFLLGVLIGITDVFLEMFNILAEVLNLFGLHIQKIQLLNDTLQQLNNTAKPLLEITHDLPTANEYNQGHWADLETQNDNLNNNVFQGFNQQLVAIGQVIGILLASKVLLGIIAGHSVSSQLGGIVSFVKGLFGLGTAPDTAGGAAPGQEGPGAVQPPPEPDQIDQWTENSQDNQDILESLNTSNQTLAEVAPEQLAYTQENIVQTPINTDATTANTTALNNTTSSLGSLIGFLPALIGLFTGGQGLGGGALGSILGGGLGVLSNLFGKNSGASLGRLDTGNYLTAAEDVFKGLSSGGTFSETLSGIAEAIGTAFGGPAGWLIGPLAGALGGLIGGLFGPHINAYNDPDIDDTQNYGQGVANLIGTNQANGQNFTESPEMQALFGGQTGLAGIEEELAKGMTQFIADTGLTAQDYYTDLADFGASATGSGTLNFGHNIGDQWVTGAAGATSSVKRYNDLDNALNQFAQALETTTNSVQALLGVTQTLTQAQAYALDLATIYGNGSTIVNPRNEATSGGIAFNITFGNVHANDGNKVVNAIKPALTAILEQQARKIQQFTDSSKYSTGRL